jgi:fatty acid desaturase
MQTFMNISDKKELLTLNPALTWVYLLVEWGLIIGTAILTEYFSHPAVYLASVIVIGSRQHALGFHYHEACHGLLFRNRKWNDRVGVLCMGWPLFVDLAPYRNTHLRHHANTNTSNDPDWVDNQPEQLKSARGFLQKFVVLSGFDRKLGRALGLFLKKDTQGKKDSKLLKYGYYMLLFAALAFFSLLEEFFLYWLVPFIFYLLPVMRFRGISEHWATCNSDSLTSTRTVIVSRLTQFLLYPKNTNFHLEHHLFPHIPFYNLPRAHAILMRDDIYRTNAHITRGLRGLFREICQYGNRFGYPGSR